MWRDYVLLSGVLYIFLDLDTAAGGRCWTQTEDQDYWYSLTEVLRLEP